MRKRECVEFFFVGSDTTTLFSFGLITLFTVIVIPKEINSNGKYGQ